MCITFGFSVKEVYVQSFKNQEKSVQLSCNNTITVYREINHNCHLSNPLQPVLCCGHLIQALSGLPPHLLLCSYPLGVGSFFVTLHADGVELHYTLR